MAFIIATITTTHLSIDTIIVMSELLYLHHLNYFFSHLLLFVERLISKVAYLMDDADVDVAECEDG